MLKYTALLIVACLVMSGCQRASTQASPLTITMQVMPDPPKVGPVTLDLQVRDESDQPLAGAQVAVEASMTHAGMVPVQATAERVADGQYRAQVPLSMSGDWLITVVVQQADGRTFEEVLPLRSVQP